MANVTANVMKRQALRSINRSLGSLGRGLRAVFLMVTLGMLWQFYGVSDGSQALAQSYPLRLVRLHLDAQASEAQRMLAAQWSAKRLADDAQLEIEVASVGTTAEFIYSIQGLQDLGYDFAMVEYPEIAGYEAGLWTLPEGVKTFDWRALNVVGSLAFDPAIFLAKGGTTQSGVELLKSFQQSTEPIAIGVRAGSVASLAWLRLISDQLSFPITPMTYTNLAELTEALKSDVVSAAFWSLSEVIDAPERKSGSIRLLSVAGSVEHPRLPYTPTLKDKGISLVLGRTLVMVTPRQTPDQAVNYWRDVTSDVLKDSALRNVIYDHGMYPPISREERAKSVIVDQTEAILDALKPKKQEQTQSS